MNDKTALITYSSSGLRNMLWFVLVDEMVYEFESRADAMKYAKEKGCTHYTTNGGIIIKRSL